MPSLNIARFKRRLTIDSLRDWPRRLRLNGQQYTRHITGSMAESGSPDGESEGEPVTLCIAAPCEHESKPVVVFCVDSLAVRGEAAGAVSVTDTDKLRWPTPHCALMIAGTLTSADALVAVIAPALRQYESAHFGEDPDIYVDGLIKALKESMQRRKVEVIDEFLKERLGISFEEFKEHGKTRFSESHYIETWLDIKGLHLAADTILVTFSGGEAVILRTDVHGDVHWEEHYSTIGSGSTIADAFLCQRGYYDKDPLMDCMYRVMEAKTAAERNVYVGTSAYAFFITEDDKLYGINYEGNELLREKIVDRLVSIPKDLTFNPKHFAKLLRPKRLRG